MKRVVAYLDQLISISLLVLLIALLLPALTRIIPRRHRRAFQYAILAVYILANLYETILFRTAKENATYELSLLWSYRRSIALDYGVLGTIEQLLTNGVSAALDGIHITDKGLLLEILLNILLYVPLGYLLPYVWPKLMVRAGGEQGRTVQTKKSSGQRFFAALVSPWRVWLIGLLASVVTELSQLIFYIGLFEFDDVLNNTLGSVVGSLIYLIAMRERQSNVQGSR